MGRGLRDVAGAAAFWADAGREHQFEVLDAVELDPSWRGAFLPIGDPTRGFVRIVAPDQVLDRSWHFLLVTGVAEYEGRPVPAAVTVIPPTQTRIRVEVYTGAGWIEVDRHTPARWDCDLDF